MKKLLIIIGLMTLIGCQQNSSQQEFKVKNTVDEAPITNQSNLEPETKNIPEVVRAHFKQGTYFLTKNDYQNAIRKLQLTVKLKPDFVQAHYNLGVAYFETQQAGLAIEEWNTAINLDPDYAKAYLSLGFAYEQLSDTDKAVENYDKYLQLKPDDSNAKVISQKITTLRGQIVGQGLIGRIAITDKVNPETFEPIEAKDIFTDTLPVIYTTAEVGDAPENTKVKVVWYYLGLKGEDILVNSAEKVITGPQNMLFELNKPTNKPWPTGRYEIRIFLNGKENLSVPFTILKEEKKPNATGKNS